MTKMMAVWADQHIDCVQYMETQNSEQCISNHVDAT